MLIFTTDTGPRHVADSDVRAIHRGGGDAHYTFCVLVLRNGDELSGAVANAALAALETKIGEAA